MLKDYFVRGWDKEGWPKLEALKKLGLIEKVE
jgi:hypothetical protein